MLLDCSAVCIIYSKKGTYLSFDTKCEGKNNFRGDEKYNSHTFVSAEEDAEARILIK